MSTSQAVIVAGLGYGDEGKGSIVDFLSRNYPVHTVVRYNGAAQAGHNVVTPDGKQHTFSQFGSGSFVPGVQTYLSEHMAIQPLSMLFEAKHLNELGVENILERTFINYQALVITPYHRAVNRLLELSRGANQHGTCGMGVGQCIENYLDFGDQVLFTLDLLNSDTAYSKLDFLRHQALMVLESLKEKLPNTHAVEKERKIIENPRSVNDCVDIYENFSKQVQIVDDSFLSSQLKKDGMCVLEGAQGVLLHHHFGFHPHTTWSDTSFANALRLLNKSGYQGSVTKLGILRAFTTRHGAGPLVSHSTDLTKNIPEPHNDGLGWQGNFRTGWLDTVATRYAINVCGGVDAIALTCLDLCKGLPELQVCTGYEVVPANIPRARALLNNYQIDWQSFSDIRFSEMSTLERQSKITELLFDCRPQLTKINGGVSGLVPFVEEQLGVPVTILSNGPTATDKSELTRIAY